MVYISLKLSENKYGPNPKSILLNHLTIVPTIKPKSPRNKILSKSLQMHLPPLLPISAIISLPHILASPTPPATDNEPSLSLYARYDGYTYYLYNIGAYVNNTYTGKLTTCNGFDLMLNVSDLPDPSWHVCEDGVTEVRWSWRYEPTSIDVKTTVEVEGRNRTITASHPANPFGGALDCRFEPCYVGEDWCKGPVLNLLGLHYTCGTDGYRTLSTTIE
ncbi:unnamed protein product [Periconia digitata]|uniref:Uncharacterized protein n=1 Tax=Periconia digitata TaxID=1303443 RepID=A0A9W4U9I3_9PLEO|nr:unnamed protein product [Periconia digitata]